MTDNIKDNVITSQDKVLFTQLVRAKCSYLHKLMTRRSNIHVTGQNASAKACCSYLIISHALGLFKRAHACIVIGKANIRDSYKQVNLNRWLQCVISSVSFLIIGLAFRLFKREHAVITYNHSPSEHQGLIYTSSNAWQQCDY